RVSHIPGVWPKKPRNSPYSTTSMLGASHGDVAGSPKMPATSRQRIQSTTSAPNLRASGATATDGSVVCCPLGSVVGSTLTERTRGRGGKDNGCGRRAETQRKQLRHAEATAQSYRRDQPATFTLK